MEDVNKLFTKSLARIVDAIQQLNQLLINDSQYFIANDLQKINDSNNQKNQLLIELSDNMHELTNMIPISINGKKPSLSEYVNELDSRSSNQAKVLLEKLYTSLSAGYNHLVTNNNVVVANLGFINTFWDNLLKLTQQNDGIYTKPEKK